MNLVGSHFSRSGVWAAPPVPPPPACQEHKVGNFFGPIARQDLALLAGHSSVSFSSCDKRKISASIGIHREAEITKRTDR